MRLLFNPTNQVFFKKTEDDKMKGYIQISNPTADTIFAFKVKCTNPDFFIVSPLKGMIKAGKKVQIDIKTYEIINLEMARQLASKHKFLIEFVPIASQLSIPNYKNQESDRKKYYINMDSIRGSRLFKDHDKLSVRSDLSNKLSYVSIKNQDQKNFQDKEYLTPRKYDESRQINLDTNENQDLNHKYQDLKMQLENLHKERQDIINQMSSSIKQKKINIKKLILFVIFILIGVLFGYQVEQFWQKRKLQKLQEELKTKSQSQPWRILKFLDFFYDEIDPNEF